MAQLTQRFRLDLANALAGYAELAPHFLQRAAAPVLQTEAQLQHAAFAAGERSEHVLDLFLQELVRGGVRWGQGAVVLDEVAEVAVFLLADWGFERNRLLRDLNNLSHLLGRDLHAAADLFAGRLAAVLLNQSPA